PPWPPQPARWPSRPPSADPSDPSRKRTHDREADQDSAQDPGRSGSIDKCHKQGYRLAIPHLEVRAMSSPAAIPKRAPGVRQLVPLPYGPMARSRRDPLGFLLDGLLRYGDVFRYQIGPLVFHQVAHPDHVKHVLLDNQKNYPRSWYYGRAKVVTGNGLVTTEGPAWKRLRRMAQPAFHHQWIEALADLMTGAIESMRVRWREHARVGGPLDVAAEFMALTLRI